MINPLQIFESEEFGNIRIVNVKNTPFFVGSDVAKALGYKNPTNALIAHVDEEDKTTTLIQGDGSNYKSNTTIINESGLYSLIMSSKLENARKFKHWVTSVVLPSIRKTGSFSTKTAPVSQVRSHYEAIKLKKELLNLNDTSVAMLINKTDENLGIMGQTIEYTSSIGVKKSMTALLKENGYSMSAQKANKLLVDKGLLRVCTRNSHKGIKKFYNITNEGAMFGENVECPNNPNETQPLWYVDKFKDLMACLG